MLNFLTNSYIGQNSNIKLTNEFFVKVRRLVNFCELQLEIKLFDSEGLCAISVIPGKRQNASFQNLGLFEYGLVFYLIENGPFYDLKFSLYKE